MLGSLVTSLENKEMSFPEIPFNETLFDNELMQEYWNRSTENRSNQLLPDAVFEERELPSELEELERMSIDSVPTKVVKSKVLNNNRAQKERVKDASVTAKSFTTPKSSEIIGIILIIFLFLVLMSNLNWK